MINTKTNIVTEFRLPPRSFHTPAIEASLPLPSFIQVVAIATSIAIATYVAIAIAMVMAIDCYDFAISNNMAIFLSTTAMLMRLLIFS